MDQEEKTLSDLIFDFCEKYAFSLMKSDIDKLDYIMLKASEKIGIMIKDWNRAMGVDIVIEADRIKRFNEKISHIIILTNRYSLPAVSLANKVDIEVFNRKEFLNEKLGEKIEK